MPRSRQGAPISDAAKIQPAPALRQRRYSQSLERGLAILACFSAKRHTLGIAEIADSVAMSRSTTHRYVITLVALGYMEQDANRKYRLGLRVTDLGLSAINSVGLRDHAREPLEELRRNSSFTVNLAVLDGPNVLYIERMRSYRPGQHLIDLGLHLGSRLPAFCTALGKTLLAYLSEEELKETLSAMSLTPRTPKSITSRRALRDELELIRRSGGLAINDEELATGLHSIAVVRSAEDEVIAAINMAAHISMISSRRLIEKSTAQLIETAKVISVNLSEAHSGERPNTEDRHE